LINPQRGSPALPLPNPAPGGQLFFRPCRSQPAAFQYPPDFGLTENRCHDRGGIKGGVSRKKSRSGAGLQMPRPSVRAVKPTACLSLLLRC